jgi:hypothetical protein
MTSKIETLRFQSTEKVGLLDGASGRHRPNDFNLIVPYPNNVIEKIANDADVIGNDGDALTDLGLSRTAAEIDMTMFFRITIKIGFRIFEQQTIAWGLPSIR